MKPNSHEQSKRHTFDSFCKKVLKHEARDYYDELKRQRDREVSFSDLSEKELAQLYTEDKYFVSEQIFNVLGLNVIVTDDVIAEALQSLPERKRDIILLSYFLELSDREIGDKLNMLRSTVQYQRTNNGIGAEQRGYRPVLIIQNNTGNKFSPTVIVAVITGQIHHKARMPTHCQLSSHSALSIPSMALLEQITTIDKRRLKKYIGRISEEEISCINKALSISVGLESL